MDSLCRRQCARWRLRSNHHAHRSWTRHLWPILIKPTHARVHSRHAMQNAVLIVYPVPALPHRPLHAGRLAAAGTCTCGVARPAHVAEYATTATTRFCSALPTNVRTSTHLRTGDTSYSTP
ncbi:hypothetical protein P171DRAFT_129970 [Karstenula rhodostoma CBS 690.94]|uniref:Uncharacterized protein n=1 Tax=Karstenula rhodostoma CBS 690.94 TaxID=1392251 RepID=A0A9P4P7R9_9PLEO|nr:hypothetical protein P171DRAFT_129970 [Karstenula rhodostoma CBS 690.94]